MKTQLALALALFCASASAFANILTTEDSADRVGPVVISKGGKLKAAAASEISMSTVAAGIRTKLGLMTIYVGELLVSDKSKYGCSEANSLNSLDNLEGVAVKLHINWSITEAQLEEAFTGGFEANKVQITPEIQKFMDSIRNGGAIPSGSNVIVAAERVNGKEIVTYQNATGQAFSTEGGQGFIRAILGLWVGKTRDGGLKDLRNNFVNCKIQ